MYGQGHRRICPECGQSVAHDDNGVSHRELQGPRNITSSNIDRVFDDDGRLLFIEEKHWGEPATNGQRRLLAALAEEHTVWLVRGEPENLEVWSISGGRRRADGEYILRGKQEVVGAFEDYQRAVLHWFKEK